MSRIRRPCALALALLAGGVTASAVGTEAGEARGPCGRTAATPTWRHVVVIVMENHSFSQIAGHSPYLNGLAATCGLATSYHAGWHPSLPNYIAMTSGGTQGIVSDCSPSATCSTAAASVFSQLGSGWRAYQESMPSTCSKTNSGRYAVRHNPPAYFRNLAVSCPVQDVPLGTTTAGALQRDLAAGTLPRYAFITPNLCSDEHDCSIATGHAWLGRWIPRILGARNYAAGDTALFVTYDEDGHNEGNRVYTVVVSPSTPRGVRVATSHTHFALLLTTEQMLGLPCLGEACRATSLRAGFHL